MPEVVVIHAVDLPVDLVGAGAVQRAKAADVVAAEARLNSNELREIAPVQRCVLHHVVSDSHALRRGGGIQRNRGS